MITSLKNFPFKGKANDYPRSDYKTALEWKEAFEKELIEQWKQIEQFKTRLDDIAFINKSVQEAQFKGEILQIKEVLGLPILTQLKDLPSNSDNKSRSDKQ
jgi:hypothetical protein